jgi:acetoin utilization deacetylase AcuC-like enzyme
MYSLKAYYCDQFVLPLPPEHRFPMDKYRLLRHRLQRDNEGRFELLEPPGATDRQLALAHATDYIHRVARGRLGERKIRELGFPWSAELVERSRRSSGATLCAARVALDDGVAANLAGGTHHAFHDRAQGFCVFNDAAVTTLCLLDEGRIGRVLVVDCDVHQGDGTAQILRHDARAFTFSMHGERNYPFRKQESDLDVPLPDGCDDKRYLAALEGGLSSAMARADPELVIYLAGADPYRGDRWGRMNLSKEGLGQRDAMVFESCRLKGAAVMVAMAGGYAKDINDSVDIHFQTLEQAAALRATPPGQWKNQ